MNTISLFTRVKAIFSSSLAIVLGIALVKLVLHLYINVSGGYGYFRDELYYIACTEHPDIGYVDHPPFSIYLLTINRFLFGDSIFALRLLPALLGSAVVFLTGLICRALGGKTFAQALAACGALFSLVYLGMNSVYSMNSIDIFLWTLIAYLILRLVNEGNTRIWYWLGLLLGLGLLNKISVLWLGSGLFVGLLLTPERKWLKTKYPYIAGAIALALFVPYIVWNFMHDFAQLEFAHNAATMKYESQNQITFLSELFLQHNPLSAPLWFAGIWFFFFSKRGKGFRILGYIFLLPLIILLVNTHSKAEYLSPTFSILFAGGAIVIQQALDRRWLTWLRPVYLVSIIASGSMLAPMVLTILPVEQFISYTEKIGMRPPTAEGHRLESLPQFYADMFGWEEKAEAVARAYNALSPEEKKICAVFGDNYGRCAAIDFFGGKYGLPKSIGRHNSYWIWGPREFTGEIVLILGGDLEHKQEDFESVEIVGTVSCGYCMPYENNLNIYLCRKLKVPLKEAWKGSKFYI